MLISSEEEVAACKSSDDGYRPRLLVNIRRRWLGAKKPASSSAALQPDAPTHNGSVQRDGWQIFLLGGGFRTWQTTLIGIPVF